LPPESKITNEMRSYTLPIDGNPFEELLASVRFENVGKGRQGAVLTKIDETGSIPIVRTTTRYSFPAQHFQSIHDRLARQIQTIASLAVGFNNALIENYTNAYITMGSHSDQALDLAEDSSIAIFSCYKHPDLANPPRKLLVELKESSDDSPKGTLRERIEIPLTHNSVIVFSVDTNRRFKHKIVLDKSVQMPENQWLGITFRTSKTFVRFRDEYPYFPDDTRLTLANDEQRQEFYHLRHRENNETDFIYPQITYTIGESDMIQP
jgi:2OG-Fe(II) oxygenase superfamily